MNSSRFHVWRAIISFAHVDTYLISKERQWIEDHLGQFDLTPEQSDILDRDLEAPTPLEDLLPQITDQKDRAFLLDRVRVLSRVDGMFEASEKATIEKLRDLVLLNLDMNKLNSVIAEDEKASYHEDNQFRVTNKDSLFESLHRKLQKHLNPGEFNFPRKK